MFATHRISHARTAWTRAYREVQQIVVPLKSGEGAYAADPELAAMRLDFTTTLREAAEVLISGLLARSVTARSGRG